MYVYAFVRVVKNTHFMTKFNDIIKKVLSS